MPALIKLRYALGLIIALMFSAIFGMSYYYDGTTISKLLCKNLELERVQEAKIEAYSDQVLYGDALVELPENVDLTASSSNEEGFLLSERIRTVDNIVILSLTIIAWLMLIPKLQNIRWLSFIYLIFAVYVIGISVSNGINGGAIFSELALPAHALRWLPCIAMWVWLFYGENSESTSLKSVIYLLILASSLTFAVHGYEAFNQHPKFKDLLYSTLGSISIPLSESICIVLLKIIGIKDILLAITVLFSVYRWRWILLWMAFWGGLTAMTRPISFGDVSWLDALLRVGNGAIPLLLFLLLKQLDKQRIKHNETT